MPLIKYSTALFIINSCFLTSVSKTCLVIETTNLKRNSVVSGDPFHVIEMSTPSMCMKECLTFPLCSSINIYPDSLLCELMIQNSSDTSASVVTSPDGMSIDAADISAELAGECYDNHCLLDEKCIGRQSQGYVCLPYEFCPGSPISVETATYTIDKSRGVPFAIYSCLPGYGYFHGGKESHCDPLNKTWSTPGIVCSQSLPEGCGDPPPLNVPHNVTRPYQGDEFKAVYTCPSLSGQDPLDHCPLTRCTGLEQWTGGANLSCSVKDCYQNSVYDGHMTCTETGRTCQRWDIQSPHSHFYFTDRSDYHNYCRISFDTSKPWCLTTNPSSRWEYCPVPKC